MIGQTVSHDYVAVRSQHASAWSDRRRKSDRAKAAEYYRQFVRYWGDGDLDRERVADARRRLGT